MCRLQRSAFAAAMAATMAAGAHAADGPGPAPAFPPIVQAPPPQVEQFTSGWYLRGDIGYRFNNLDSVSALTGPNPVNNEISDSLVLGIGAGYKVNWFRTDVTLDYGGRMSYDGTRSIAGDYSAKIDSYTALFNVYFDLGTWSGFTPYIGGGVGGSFLRGRDFAWRNNTARVDAIKRWNLGWAGMAGIGYAVSPNLSLDLGYRYIDLGDATTNYDTANNQLYLNGLTAHEIRIGARYLLD